MNNKNDTFRHIAIVSSFLSTSGGGAPRSIAGQALALALRGYNVTLFAGKNRRYPFTPEELGIDGLRTFASRLWGPGVLGIFPGALLKLWKLAPALDVIHLNGAWNLTTFLAGLIAHFRKTPYIISCRSHYGDYHFSRMPLLKKALFATLESINIRNAYALHFTADWEEKTSWRAVRLAKRIIKIPNPVNLSDFENPLSRIESRRLLGLDPEGFYVLHLGRLGKQKNLSFLMYAFHKANLGTAAHLVFVGPPEKAEKDKLQALAQSLGIDQQTIFIDFAKSRERCHWLAAADIFALPSNDENFCIAAIESVATGTNCLLSPHVGATEYLPPESISVKNLVIGQWAAELVRCRTNPAHHGSIYFEALVKRFSMDAITDEWFHVYQAMTDNKNHM